jgi:hypothetical protein
MTSLETEPASVRFVAQCLNQVRHQQRALQQSNSLKGKKMIRDGWMVGIKTAKEQEKLEETGQKQG